MIRLFPLLATVIIKTFIFPFARPLVKKLVFPLLRVIASLPMLSTLHFLNSLRSVRNLSLTGGVALSVLQMNPVLNTFINQLVSQTGVEIPTQLSNSIIRAMTVLGYAQLFSRLFNLAV